MSGSVYYGSLSAFDTALKLQLVDSGGGQLVGSGGGTAAHGPHILAASACTLIVSETLFFQTLVQRWHCLHPDPAPVPCFPYPVHQTLDPLSYKVDLDQLGRRSKDTKWRWETVRKWLDKVDNSRALCILAGEQAGDGRARIVGKAMERVLIAHLSIQRNTDLPPLQLNTLPLCSPTLFRRRHRQVQYLCSPVPAASGSAHRGGARQVARTHHRSTFPGVQRSASSGPCWHHQVACLSAGHQVSRGGHGGGIFTGWDECSFQCCLEPVGTSKSLAFQLVIL